MAAIPSVGSRSRQGPISNSRKFSRADLQNEGVRLLDSSLSASTRKLYDAGVQKFEGFRAEYGINLVWPPDVSDVINFVSYLSLTGFAVSSIRAYVSAIAYKCRISGLLDPTQNFLVSKLLQGLNRTRRSKDVRLPITPSILVRVLLSLPRVCKTLYEASLFSLAYSLAFYGFFRVGELVVTQAEHGLQIRNVQLIDNDQAISLGLQSSKTDQSGAGVVLVLEARDGITCPVRCYQQFISRRPGIGGYLLCHEDRSPLTRYQFCAVLKMAISQIGLNSAHYNSHSFRVGSATTAYGNSVTEDNLKAYGRWSSEAFRTYIRIPKHILD